MKLDKYGVGQSQQSIQELAEAFYQYKENYKDESGQIYWKESDSAVSSKMSLKNRTKSRMVSFVSNDYFGFSQHPLVQSDAIRAINQFGTGFCAAPSIGGYSSLQKRLEDGISALLKTEDTLVFNSGFSANIGLFSALAKPNDIVFLDKGVHRSVFEGVRHCTCKILPHNDPEALDSALQRYKVEGSNLYVVIDGVYSQDGDRGLVQDYLEISQKHGALLIVDDAHGVGVLGEHGAGLLEELNLLGQVPLVTGTLSKAFGRWEIAELIYQQLINTNREKELFPKIVYTKNCAANRVNSYIIGPEGEIYKCWNDVSNPNMIVGYIDKSEITNPQLYYRYHSSCSCFNDPSCRECFYLPICNGKCSWYQLKNKYNGGQFNLCQCLLKAPGMRDKILEKYYDYVTQ